jgi:hypothetical protein
MVFSMDLSFNCSCWLDHFWRLHGAIPFCASTRRSFGCLTQAFCVIGVLTCPSIETAFHSILLPFYQENFFAHVGHGSRGSWYRLHALRLSVGNGVGKLKGATEVSDTAPAIQKHNFAYINDAEVGAIIMRDYDETISGAWSNRAE